MWTTNRTLSAKVLPRPAKIAYLVPEKPSHELLDEVIGESLSRWGGRRTPIIPTNGSDICEPYWKLLDYWDADIIYAFCELSEKLQDRLYYSFAPSELIVHYDLVSEQPNYRPNYYGNYRFLSSLSLLPGFDRQPFSLEPVTPEILDNEFWTDDVRDFADSFGFLLRSCVSEHVNPHATRVSVRPKPLTNQARQSHERETKYFETVEQWIDAIAERPQTLMLSRLADTLCPTLKCWSDYQSGWNNHLTVVIGDEPSDRLLSWHAQHRYSGLNLFDDIPILRVSPTRLQAGIPDWLLAWITKRNCRHLDQNHMKRTILRSCSLPAPKLEAIATEIRERAKFIFIGTEQYDDPSAVFTGETDREAPGQWSFPNTKAIELRFTANELDLPMVSPSHLPDQKPAQLVHGIWAVNLTIDRLEDHSQFDNQPHVWTFPRRLRLEQSVKLENYAKDLAARFSQVRPPPPRPSREGDLTIWESAGWTRPVLILPNDFAAFSKAISEIPHESPEMQRRLKAAGPDRHQVFPFRFSDVSISDKGRDLLGVLQFFDSLPEALMYLNDQFWIRTITRLLPEELEEKKKYVKEISKLIADSLPTDKDTQFDGSLIAKRALQLAAQSYSSQQIKTYTFETLLSDAKEFSTVEQDRGDQLKHELVSSVTHLRNNGFLWQGFWWKCGMCEHENWLSLERLTSVSSCEICRRGKSSPVDGNLHFRLSPFVQHAFAASSSQGPVLWCLEQLATRAHLSDFRRKTKSFSFAPALNLFTDSETQPWTDIDITANVNGQIVLVEVKKSWAGVTQKTLNQLYDLGHKLRPNVVLLAVQSNLPENDFLENLQMLRRNLSEDDVMFAWITPNEETESTFFSLALPYSRKMTWSAW
jgi:hypothetical protein